MFQRYVCNASDLAKVGHRRNDEKNQEKEKKIELQIDKTGAGICATGLSVILSTNFEL